MKRTENRHVVTFGRFETTKIQAKVLIDLISTLGHHTGGNRHVVIFCPFKMTQKSNQKPLQLFLNFGSSLTGPLSI